LTGEFETANYFAELSAAEKNFVSQFLLCEGNLTKMQERLQLSYTSVKDKLSGIVNKLGLKAESGHTAEEEIKMVEVTQNDSKAVRLLKENLSASGGKSQMAMLRGDDVAIWFSSDKRGIIAEGLKSVTLEWEVFDAIIEKAVTLGGKMFRGDSAAHNGKRIGSDELPLDTIDAFVATTFFGAREGDSTLRRSTYYAGVLAWAGIVDNCRSHGEGGYILVKPEYE